MDAEETKKREVVLCEVCQQKPFKYTCPGCNKRTCSLQCVRKHKADDHCTGVRNRTKFVSLNEFNDAVLHDDYFFLTDVARKVDSSAKSIIDFPSWSTPHLVEEAKNSKNQRVPSYLSALIKQAADRHVTLITLPLGMSRQKENRTRYIFGKGLIMWYSKWYLASISPVLSFSVRCSELDDIGTTVVNEISKLSSHLYPLVAKYKHTNIDGMILLMEKYSPYDDSVSPSASQKEYYIVPPNHSFRDVLSGVTLLEFPVFYVIFPSDLSKFSVENLPMVPLDPWKAPERPHKEAQEPSEKRIKIEESSVCQQTTHSFVTSSVSSHVSRSNSFSVNP